jgi:DNA-binding protein HU-beta
VQIVGFGTFSVTEREPREGINPRTGDKIQIGVSKSVRFKAGSKLKEVL